MFRWSASVVWLFICVVAKWSPSTALPNIYEKTEHENTLNGQTDRVTPVRQLRRQEIRNSVQGESYDGPDARSDGTGHENILMQQDLEQLKQEHPSSSSSLSGPGEYQFKDQESNQHLLQVCRRMKLDFAKAANGRMMSGGEFVGGEWFHHYGVNIYAEGHDGEKNLHPMIFDSANVESNGLVDNKDVFALGSPNFDCGGFGFGRGGKEGKPGENCESLGNVLIPSRKPGSPSLSLKNRGRSPHSLPGGVLIFEFDKTTKVDNIKLLNIMGWNQIMAIHNDGSLEKIDLVSVDKNGFQNVPLDLDNVKRLYVTLQSFAAVAGIDLCMVVD